MLHDRRRLWNHDQFLRDHPAAGGHILDVGCGPGWFLARAKQAGYDVCGLDFDEAVIRLGRRNAGVEELHCLSVDDALRRWQGRFDAVTLFEVVEHTDDPIAFLQEVRQFLRPGGYLALSVPNRERWLLKTAPWDTPPHHLTKWNAAALRKILESAGLEIERMAVKSIDWGEIRDAIGVFLQQRRIRTGLGRLTNQRALDDAEANPVSNTAARLVVRARQGLLGVAAVPFWPLIVAGRRRGLNLYALTRTRV